MARAVTNVLIMALILSCGVLYLDSLAKVWPYNSGSEQLIPEVPAVIADETQPESTVRIYGFICNKDGTLLNQRREGMDLVESVIFKGHLVNCTPTKSDYAIDNGKYLMKEEGTYTVDGIEYPRSEVATEWSKFVDTTHQASERRGVH